MKIIALCILFLSLGMIGCTSESVGSVVANGGKEVVSSVVEQTKDQPSQIWNIAGALLVVAGGFATAFIGVQRGVPLIVAGAFCGVIPFIINSGWFNWAAGISITISLGMGVWWIYDKLKDSIEDNEPPAKS